MTVGRGGNDGGAAGRAVYGRRECYYRYCMIGVLRLRLGGFAGRVGGAVGRPVDAASLAAFRVLFGLAALLIVGRFFAYGWIGELYIEPAHHFTYPGLGWVKPWPGWGMYAHFAALGLLALGIAAGYRYRLCAALFCAGFVYVELLDKTVYLNHYYWLALVSLLLVFLPLHRALSVDAWRERRTLGGAAPAGAVGLLRAQLAAVYLFAGAAKLNADWLLHGQPLHIWLQDHSGLPLIGPLLGELWAARAFSWGGALFDLSIVGWLLWRPARPAALIVLAAFHLATWLLFPQIGVFPWLMMGASLIFLAPDWPRRFLGDLGRRIGVPQTPPGAFPAGGNGNLTAARTAGTARPVRPVRPPMPLMQTAAITAAAVFIAAQLALPLRHYAYPGNVRWNEEGYRFAWRVLLTEKAGMAEYRVSDPASGRQWLAGPEDYLTPLQAERMATQPDMILETAHIIARDFAARGHPAVEVRADVFVAMNGRQYARLVDPQTDLAAVKPGLTPKSWLRPEP